MCFDHRGQRHTPRRRFTVICDVIFTLLHRLKLRLDQIIDGVIDLDPHYQRGIVISLLASHLLTTPTIDVVWSEIKQIGLIDSIFRNFYIPPIIFGSPYYKLILLFP
jgi:hypothetical protein